MKSVEKHLKKLTKEPRFFSGILRNISEKKNKGTSVKNLWRFFKENTVRILDRGRNWRKKCLKHRFKKNLGVIPAGVFGVFLFPQEGIKNISILIFGVIHEISQDKIPK